MKKFKIRNHLIVILIILLLLLLLFSQSSKFTNNSDLKKPPNNSNIFSSKDHSDPVFGTKLSEKVKDQQNSNDSRSKPVDLSKDGKDRPIYPPSAPTNSENGFLKPGLSKTLTNLRKDNSDYRDLISGEELDVKTHSVSIPPKFTGKSDISFYSRLAEDKDINVSTNSTSVESLNIKCVSSDDKHKCAKEEPLVDYLTQKSKIHPATNNIYTRIDFGVESDEAKMEKKSNQKCIGFEVEKELRIQNTFEDQCYEIDDLFKSIFDQAEIEYPCEQVNETTIVEYMYQITNSTNTIPPL